MLALPYVVLFVFVGGGAGDAKLMGAIGAWLGIVNGVIVLVLVLLAGVALAIGFALAKKQLRPVLANLARMPSMAIFFIFQGKLTRTSHLFPKTHDMQTIPYAVAIFSGVCVAAAGAYLWHAS